MKSTDINLDLKKFELLREAKRIVKKEFNGESLCLTGENIIADIINYALQCEPEDNSDSIAARLFEIAEILQGKSNPSCSSPISHSASVSATELFPASSNDNVGEEQEMIEYKGKRYPRYSSGGEFKGLYRGQARYA